MTTVDPNLTAAARAFTNAGHALVEALRQAVPDEAAPMWNELALAGAEPALTLHWADDRIEVRVGFVTGDSEPVTMLALDFPRGNASGDVTH